MTSYDLSYRGMPDAHLVRLHVRSESCPTTITLPRNTIVLPIYRDQHYKFPVITEECRIINDTYQFAILDAYTIVSSKCVEKYPVLKHMVSSQHYLLRFHRPTMPSLLKDSITRAPFIGMLVADLPTFDP